MSRTLPCTGEPMTATERRAEKWLRGKSAGLQTHIPNDAGECDQCIRDVAQLITETEQRVRDEDARRAYVIQCRKPVGRWRQPCLRHTAHEGRCKAGKPVPL